MLDALCHFAVGVVLGALLDEVAMEKIDLTCRFSFDLLCDETSSMSVVKDHVSVRNWRLHPTHMLQLKAQTLSHLQPQMNWH